MNISFSLKIPSRPGHGMVKQSDSLACVRSMLSCITLPPRKHLQAITFHSPSLTDGKKQMFFFVFQKLQTEIRLAWNFPPVFLCSVSVSDMSFLFFFFATLSLRSATWVESWGRCFADTSQVPGWGPVRGLFLMSLWCTCHLSLAQPRLCCAAIYFFFFFFRTKTDWWASHSFYFLFILNPII